jgi:hypothetical protein
LGVGDYPSREERLGYNNYINRALKEHCGINYSEYISRPSP